MVESVGELVVRYRVGLREGFVVGLTGVLGGRDRGVVGGIVVGGAVGKSVVDLVGLREGLVVGLIGDLVGRDRGVVGGIVDGVVGGAVGKSVVDLVGLRE